MGKRIIDSHLSVKLNGAEYLAQICTQHFDFSWNIIEISFRSCRISIYKLVFIHNTYSIWYCMNKLLDVLIKKNYFVQISLLNFNLMCGIAYIFAHMFIGDFIDDNLPGSNFVSVQC